MKAGTLLAVTFVLIFLTAIPVRAGKFAGIEPGRSTKEEVEAALGAALATVSGGERYDYDGKRYQAKVISIRYSPEDFVVENIDIYPIPETFKAEYQRWFALAAPTSTEEDETGNLVEYYFPQAVILHYQGPTDVEPVEYFSHVPFEKSEPEKILERVGAEEPTLTASPSSVRPGDFITLKFSGAPGNAQDWIGLHPVDAPSERYGQWHYLEGKTEGELSFTAPEKEGDYEFRLFANWPEGGYEAIAISDLIRVGIKPLTPGLDNQLLKAAGEGDMEQVQEALQSGAKVNTKDENGWTPLLRASGKGYTDIVRTLIQAGADLDWEATTGQTALNVAALEGHIEIVRALIEAGAEMNEKSKNAQIDYFKDATAIFMASRAGHTEIVWMLVQSGAEVDARNSRGDTPLFLAALSGHTDTVRALIEAGADVNATGRYGETSLMLAAVEGQNDIVEMLIQAGAEVNRKAVGDEQGEGAGWTALMIAAMAGHTDVVSQLLTAGADPKTINDAGENALDIAKSEGNKEAVRLLEAVKKGEKAEKLIDKPEAQLLFSDDFDQGELEQNWLVKSGNWVIEDGKLKSIGRSGLIWLMVEMPDDIAVQVEVQGAYDLNLAIAGNGSDSTGYLFDFGGWSNTKTVLVGEGQIVMENTELRITDPNKTYFLKMERRNNIVTCFIDGRLIFTYNKATLEASEGDDKIAFRNWGSPITFDNLKVTDLEATAGGDVLDLSQAPEGWTREWMVVSTAENFAGGGKAGFYPEAVRSGDANPNPGREGILYLHPKTQKEPAKIARLVTLTGPTPTLKMGVSGNRDVDGDWALVVKVNGQPLEEEKIIAGSQGWQDLTFDLSAFSGEIVSIEIEARANNWHYEYIFFDYLRIDKEAEEEKSPQVSIDAPPPPVPGLIAYWKFDEGSGSRVQDNSGNGNDGTIQGARWATGRFGKALSFDGVDDYVELSTPWTGEPNTFECWLKIPATVPDGTRVGIVAGNYPDTNNINWEVHTSGRPRVYWNNGEINWVISGIDLRTGNWLHYASVRDKAANKFYFYLNGVLAGTLNTGVGTDITPATASHIGNDKRGSGTPWFNGTIDEVRIYNRALSQSEIQANMKATQPVVQPTSTPTPYNDVFRLSTGELIIGELLSFDGSMFRIKTKRGVLEKKREEIIAVWLGVAP